LSKEASVPSRKGRPNHPLDFKRRLAQQACEAGVSVSRLAREHGINANMLFKWRRHYRQGLFDETVEVAALLPVSIATSPSPTPASPVGPAALAAVPDPAASAAIEIVFRDCTVRVDGSANLKTLRAVLALLRQ
jgi:transposase